MLVLGPILINQLLMLARVQRSNSMVFGLLQFIPKSDQWTSTKQKLLAAIADAPTDASLITLLKRLQSFKRYDPELWNSLLTVVVPRLSTNPSLLGILCKTSTPLKSKGHFELIEGIIQHHKQALKGDNTGLVLTSFSKANVGSSAFWANAADLLYTSLDMNPTLLSQSILAVAKANPSVNFGPPVLDAIIRNEFSPLGVSALLAACVETGDRKLLNVVQSKLVRALENADYTNLPYFTFYLHKLGCLAEYESLLIPKLLTAQDYQNPKENAMLAMSFANSSDAALKDKIKAGIFKVLPSLDIRTTCNILNSTLDSDFFNDTEIGDLTSKASKLLKPPLQIIDLLTIAHVLSKKNLSCSPVLKFIDEALLDRLSPDEIAILAYAIRRNMLDEGLLNLVRRKVEENCSRMNPKHILNMSVMWTENRLFTKSTWAVLEPLYNSLTDEYVIKEDLPYDYIYQCRIIQTRLITHHY
mmetsp:Transcript_848/g.1969  ORF Transcript_848/g.1969 Transcript_848/m.1969 type:complete len:472 (-) Transcript_848:7347-8762(-)